MGRLGSSSGSGPDFPTALSDADFQRIETAVNEFENGRFALPEKLRQQTSKLVHDYAVNRILYENQPLQTALRKLLRPLPDRVGKLIGSLNDIVAQGGKDEKTRVLMGTAEDLLAAHYAQDRCEFMRLLTDLHRLSLAARLAVTDCAKLGRTGRDVDDTIERSLDELKDVYRKAGGRSIEPSSTFVTRGEAEREARISGFVVFVHECLMHLPSDIYPYRNTSPGESVAVAQRVRRHGKLRSSKPDGPRFITDMIVAAQLKWVVKDRDQN